MKLIVGLGNIGKKYEKTRHNVGFFIVDRLARDLDISIGRKKFHGHYGEFVTEKGEKVYFLEPQTMMNLSGTSVAPWVNFLKIDGKEILVIHDDLDFALGKMRGQWAGSSGGHRGISSIIEELGYPQFCRLRVGIGRPRSSAEVVDYVLTPFSKEESEQVDVLVEKGIEAVKVFIEKGLDPLMALVNRKKL
jgi:peptidyl-tRNA hydrolase, PTH1 family